jgi:DNA-cytosine methyltransferase
MDEGITVLSLCDGMSCCHLALDKAGIKIKQYFSAEIKNIAIKVTNSNYPDTIQIGDVNNISYKNGILYTKNGNYEVPHFDLVTFGSPCQSFSCAMKKELRIGLEDKEKSGLFLECYRILKEVQPSYFLMENVASMKKEDRAIITKMLGVEPILINSELISPCLRKRLYWTNIPNVKTPTRIDIKLQDILDDGYTDREKGHSLLVSESRPLTTPIKIFHRYYTKGFSNIVFKNREHYEACKKYYDEHYKNMSSSELPIDEIDIFDGIRYLNQEELEKCQTVPQGYTKCLTRREAANVLGDGWTIDVIAHIFSYLPYS